MGLFLYAYQLFTSVVIRLKMEEEVPSGTDNIVTEFNTYEEFLNSQITSLDLFYLEVRTVYNEFLKLHVIAMCALSSSSIRRVVLMLFFDRKQNVILIIIEFSYHSVHKIPVVYHIYAVRQTQNWRWTAKISKNDRESDSQIHIHFPDSLSQWFLSVLFSQFKFFLHFINMQVIIYGWRSSVCHCFGSVSLCFHPESWEICTVNTRARVIWKYWAYCKSILSIFLFIIYNIFIELFEQKVF